METFAGLKFATTTRELMSRRAFRIVIVVCEACMLFSVSAHATGVYFTNAFAGVSGGATDNSDPNSGATGKQYSSSVSNPTSTSVNGSISGVDTIGVETDSGPALFSFDSSGTSTASASAAFGTLRAIASASATSTPQSYTYSSGDQTATLFNPGGGQGGSGATFRDTLTICRKRPSHDAVWFRSGRQCVGIPGHASERVSRCLPEWVCDCRANHNAVFGPWHDFLR